jgi:hypothetical protein
VIGEVGMAVAVAHKTAQCVAVAAQSSSEPAEQRDLKFRLVTRMAASVPPAHTSLHFYMKIVVV